MEHEQYDSETPHGHTARTGRRESRLVLRVTLRRGSSGMIMGDGRFHAPGYCQCAERDKGVHEIQIYKSALAGVMSLVETDEAAVDAATKIYTRRAAKWMDEHKQPEIAYGSSPQAVFRELNDRDILPFTEVKQVGELEAIALAEKRMEGDAVSASTREGQSELAAMIAEGIATALARLGIVGNSNPQNKQGGR